jgi:hypothetical protein
VQTEVSRAGAVLGHVLFDTSGKSTPSEEALFHIEGTPCSSNAVLRGLLTVAPSEQRYILRSRVCMPNLVFALVPHPECLQAVPEYLLIEGIQAHQPRGCSSGQQESQHRFHPLVNLSLTEQTPFPFNNI